MRNVRDVREGVPRVLRGSLLSYSASCAQADDGVVYICVGVLAWCSVFLCELARARPAHCVLWMPPNLNLTQVEHLRCAMCDVWGPTAARACEDGLRRRPPPPSASPLSRLSQPVRRARVASESLQNAF